MSSDPKEPITPEIVEEVSTTNSGDTTTESGTPAERGDHTQIKDKPKRDFVEERKKRRAKARNTNFKKLNVQQQKFVLATIATNSPQQAVKEAGYVPAGGTSAVNNRAAALLSSPKVVNALEEKLNELYPDLKDKIAHRLDSVLQKQVVSGKGYGPLNPMPPDCITIEEFLKVVDTMIRVNGWEAAKKSAHIRANVTAPGSYLPGSKK
jgi:hypothetical protein